ncbi:ATP-binding protein [Nocardioides sp. AE5]|uniref:sensor histidine kinase n=1 Tax=Nocardioides sp. AE5 TaxID=2962573 RepID=UPI002881C9A6|nr:ATP-binding protein [Nocardioides sp. AE5]MDT0203433.1 ATP-binding protein [Nocardioides sp. AE5]
MGPLSIVVLHPEWGVQMPLALGVATFSIIVATRFGLQVLIDFAGRADETAVKAAYEAERAVAVRVASAEAAEDARRLHDTVINTLGAIARGGAATADSAAVRSRCDHDADVIAEIGTGERGEVSLADSIAAIADRTGHPIICTGMDHLAVEQMAAAHPEMPWSMIAGIVQELVQNAVKHARATSIGVDVARIGNDVLISVRDDGIGFDGVIPAGRGLERSVLARARGVGGQVELETAPGDGTAVTLRVPLVMTEDLGETVDPTLDVEKTLPRLRARAGWLWAVGLTLVGLVLSILNRFGMWTEHYLMTGVAAVAAAYAWWRTRDGRVLPVDALVILVAGACAAFLFSMMAIDFGRSEVVYGQALGPSVALIVLVAARRRRHDWAFAVILYLAVVAVVTVLVWRSDPNAAATVQVSGVVAPWIALGWAGFQRSITKIGRRTAQEQRKIFASRLDSAARLFAEHAKRRWREAGLHTSEVLLRQIAAGTSDPRSVQVQNRCASEEAYLRQLVMLEPELVLMGEWFAQALKVGYDRDVQVVLRSGGVDVPDRETAASLGRLVLGVVEAMPAGSPVTVSLFRTSGGLQLMVVGPSQVREAAKRNALRAPNLSLEVTTIGEQDVITVLIEEADRVGAMTAVG